MRYDPWEVWLVGASNGLFEFITQMLVEGNTSEYVGDACWDVIGIRPLTIFCCLDYEFSDIEFLFALCEADLEVNLVALIGLDLVFFGAIFEI